MSFRTGITLANDGNVPLTVTGLDGSSSPFVHSLEFRLPPGALTEDLPAVNAPARVDLASGAGAARRLEGSR